MLFPYKYVSHKIEMMQTFIDYIFFDVWCNAPTTEYGIELYENNSELKEILETIWLKEEMTGKPIKSAEFFLTGINEIFNEFKKFSTDDIDQLTSWYKSNNDIKKCCNNEPDSTPVIYSQIKIDFSSLENSLELFYKNLYSHNFLKLEIIKKHIGELSEHYKEFVEENDEDICPFCGLMPLDGQWSETRDAYDHYLPKSKYPFNSINMKNLPPACNTCNSKNKGSDDPINLSVQRRKAFYPFSENIHKLNFSISINTKNWSQYTPDEITLIVGPEEHQEEINSWMDVYGIESRYKDFMCRKNVGKYWITQVRSWIARGSDVDEYFSVLLVNEKNHPYSDYNFLKKPFLENCNETGLLNTKEKN